MAATCRLRTRTWRGSPTTVSAPRVHRAAVVDMQRPKRPPRQNPRLVRTSKSTEAMCRLQEQLQQQQANTHRAPRRRQRPRPPHVRLRRPVRCQQQVHHQRRPHHPPRLRRQRRLLLLLLLRRSTRACEDSCLNTKRRSCSPWRSVPLWPQPESHSPPTALLIAKGTTRATILRIRLVGAWQDREQGRQQDRAAEAAVRMAGMDERPSHLSPRTRTRIHHRTHIRTHPHTDPRAP